MHIQVTATASGSRRSYSIAAGTTLPAFLESALSLRNVDFALSTILVNDRRIPTNGVAATTYINDNDDVFVGKAHTNGR